MTGEITAYQPFGSLMSTCSRRLTVAVTPRVHYNGISVLALSFDNGVRLTSSAPAQAHQQDCCASRVEQQADPIEVQQDILGHLRAMQHMERRRMVKQVPANQR